MNKLEIKWLRIVKENPDKYVIVVDNDCIWVNDIVEKECIFDFRNYGQDFIVELLNSLKYNAEYC